MTTKIHQTGSDRSFQNSSANNGIHNVTDQEEQLTNQLVDGFINVRINQRAATIERQQIRNGQELEVRLSTNHSNGVGHSQEDDNDLETDSCVRRAVQLTEPTSNATAVSKILPKSDRRLSAMLQLTDKFNRRYGESLGSLKEDACGLNDEAPKETFDGVMHELFSNDINWGRIVALFAFVGVMCVHAQNTGKPALTKNYKEWSTAYINEHLWPWIREHGGWEGLVEFNRNAVDNDYDEEHLWNSIKNIAKLGAVTVGAYAFVRFLTNRI